jgi:ribosomal protein S27E
MMNEFTCQWGDCTLAYELESDLYTHMKEHTKETLQTGEFPCHWKECTSTTVFRPRGNLVDHLISHTSANFVSVLCQDCLSTFRNRQALFRHRKKSICSSKGEQGLLAASSARVSSSSIPEAYEASAGVIKDILKGRLSPEKEVNGRSVKDFINAERKGMRFADF